MHKELPACYGKSFLALLEIEPGFVHALWELTAQDCVCAENHLTDRERAAWVIRFWGPKGEDSDAGEFFDIEVDPAARSWYVHFQSNRPTCLASIGLRAADTFVPVCKSNRLASDASAPCSAGHITRMDVVNGVIQGIETSERVTKSQQKKRADLFVLASSAEYPMDASSLQKTVSSYTLGTNIAGKNE
jgi:hypothetical protein